MYINLIKKKLLFIVFTRRRDIFEICVVNFKVRVWRGLLFEETFQVFTFPCQTSCCRLHHDLLLSFCVVPLLLSFQKRCRPSSTKGILLTKQTTHECVPSRAVGQTCFVVRVGLFLVLLENKQLVRSLQRHRSSSRYRRIGKVDESCLLP